MATSDSNPHIVGSVDYATAQSTPDEQSSAAESTPQEQLAAWAWPISRLGEALEALGRRRGLLNRPLEAPALPQYLLRAEPDTVGRWLELAAQRLGLEVEPIETTYTDTEQFVRAVGPALLWLPERSPSGELQFLAVLKGGWRHLTVLGPNLRSKRLKPAQVSSALTAALTAPLVPGIDQLLSAANVPTERRDAARQALLRQRLGSVPTAHGWLIRLSPGVNMAGQVNQARLPRQASFFIGAYLVRQGLEILAWTMIGLGALQGRFDWAWLLAWALVLLTMVPFQLLESWTQNQFSTAAGALFKLRLLHGTLQLDPEEVRSQGAGQFLSRTIDSEAVETLALDGGFRALIGLLRVVVACLVLAAGVGGMPHVLLFLGMVLFTLFMGWRFYRYSRDWANAHRTMTNDLVERMVGHRTRLAQEDRALWHEDEDRMLAQYLKLSHRLDRVGVQMRASIQRGWLLVGLAGIVGSLVTGGSSVAAIAISIGGILLALQALENLVAGMQSIVNLQIAWEQIAPLYAAAARANQQPANDLVLTARDTSPGGNGATAPAASGEQQAVLLGRDLTFRYPGRAQAVLQGCDLKIYAGDRVLLEGPSGGGKSTLANILTGLKTPTAGLLLLWGYDRQTLGSAEWRQRVVSAPQFHENHVLTATFAFNLLMGRRWPALPDDLDEAETICRELGLGDLLDRMPAGLQQMVGEGGWQLSHGERSRLFIARALLQRADLIVLDESFAALDPENLQRALQCVLARAPALLVIAHP